MNRIDTLREQIDAVRPGSDDLSLPGLAALAQAAEEDRAVSAELDRSQQFDRAVASALHDVTVPGDLLERLLAKTAEAALAASVSLPQPAARMTRRWIALASLAAAAVLAVSVGVFWPRPGRIVSQAELSETASQKWFTAIPVAGDWTPASRPAAAPFLLPRAVVNRRAPWRSFQTQHGPAVVYDCTRPGGARALLFVVQTRDQFTGVSATPFTVLTTSGRLSIGAWQNGGMLYVLVIDRDRQRLEDHVRPLPEV